MPFGEEVFAGVGGRTSAQGYLVNNDGIRKQFTGYERDDESGLDYAQARYFNPRHGRFTSVDPMTASAEVKNPQTLNRYSYGLNSPYKFVDPLGLRGSDLSCFGNTSGGGANSIGSCEAERSLAFYEERLQNTMDTIAINRAVANGDQATARSVCDSNANITCQREETTVTVLSAGDEYIYGRVRISIGKPVLEVDEPGEDIPGLVVWEKSDSFSESWVYPILFELLNPDGSPLDPEDYSYKIQVESSFGSLDMTEFRIGSTENQSDPIGSKWTVKVTTAIGDYKVKFGLAVYGVTPVPYGITPLAVPIALKHRDYPISHSHIHLSDF